MAAPWSLLCGGAGAGRAAPNLAFQWGASVEPQQQAGSGTAPHRSSWRSVAPDPRPAPFADTDTVRFLRGRGGGARWTTTWGRRVRKRGVRVPGRHFTSVVPDRHPLQILNQCISPAGNLGQGEGSGWQLTGSREVEGGGNPESIAHCIKLQRSR